MGDRQHASTPGQLRRKQRVEKEPRNRHERRERAANQRKAAKALQKSTKRIRGPLAEDIRRQIEAQGFRVKDLEIEILPPEDETDTPDN